MKALVKAKPEPGLWLSESEPTPAIGQDDVLVKCARPASAAPISTSTTGTHGRRRPFRCRWSSATNIAGEIVEVGSACPQPQARPARLGRRPCHRHEEPRNARGKFHLDPETRGIGVNMPGAFAEFVKVPAFNIVPLPDDVDDEMGAILDPLGNAVHTAFPSISLGKMC